MIDSEKKRLLAENDRLREALRVLADIDDDDGSDDYEDDDSD